ncbi:unnamed protein product [Trichogramma brassicae]|uniref:Uncharacterized protein n=1 Tax=Trichogramma brassicae TaxID=86971 RepID=A0A6H5IM70_9HYME|nr:unnamed protein product [Trichogramma brassicae]
MFGIVLMSISVTATLASLEPIGFGQSAEATHSSYPYRYDGAAAAQPSLKASRPSAFVGKYLPPPPLLPTTATATTTTTTMTTTTTARDSKTNRNPSASQHQQHQLLSAQGRVQATSNDVVPSINYLPVMDKPRPPSKEYLPPRQSPSSSYLPPSREYLPAAPTATAATTTTTLGAAATTFGSEYLPPSSVGPTRPSFFGTATPPTRLKNEYLSPTQVIASSTRQSVIDTRNEYLPPTSLSPPYRTEDRLTEQRQQQQQQQQPKFRALASNEPGINLVDDNYLTAVTTATEINDAIASRGPNYQYAAPTSTRGQVQLRVQGERRVRQRLRPQGAAAGRAHSGLVLGAAARRPQAEGQLRGRRARLRAQDHLRGGRQRAASVRLAAADHSGSSPAAAAAVSSELGLRAQCREPRLQARSLLTKIIAQSSDATVYANILLYTCESKVYNTSAAAAAAAAVEHAPRAAVIKLRGLKRAREADGLQSSRLVHTRYTLAYV